jgi:2-polyprenyl-6-methoxyphenol hydroxylase-like FAD-dependent oxidoreductase
MQRHVVTVGGSVAGLASAVALARRGWRATVVERDPRPATDDGDEAFLTWDRRHVPQFRQPHIFTARARNLLHEHLPEVIDRLLDDGIEEVNLFKVLTPPELWSDEDDAYANLWTRRPAFELAIRRTAEVEPGVTVLAPALVDGLLTSDGNGTAPVVTGVRLADGTRLDADLVLDCAGRRSPVPKWLDSLGVEVPTEIQDCGAIYCSRYYRLAPASDLSLFGVLGLGAGVEGMNIGSFAGDHDTYGLVAFVHTEDADLKVLRHDWAWDAAMAAFPRVAPWVDPANGTPLTGVQYMGGNQNVLRHYAPEGRPLVHGLLPVGDSLCTTNPMYGWGASMALTYAFAAVEAVLAHLGDPGAAALAYDDAVRDETEGVYRESAAMDRVRLYRWRGEEPPEWDRAEVERQELIECVAAGATKDPILGRAQLRRMGLLESPAAVLDDPTVVERAEHTRQIRSQRARAARAPTREDVLDAIAARAPTATTPVRSVNSLSSQEVVDCG